LKDKKITYKQYKELATCKELFPYDYYTSTRWRRGVGDIRDATKYLTHGNEDEFRKSIIKAGALLPGNDNKFIM
jgi:hypothetical protein